MAKFDLLQVHRSIRMLTVVALAASGLAGSPFSAFSQDAVLPAEARAMTALELYKLYRNKSWQWENGAGLMKDEGRQFSAWVDDEKGKSWADGHWAITETGLLCFKATWHSMSGALPAKTCFSHRIDARTIYQKREPDGGWYVFRHAEPQKDDEASKLVAVDLVSEHRDNIQAALSAALSPEQ